MTDVRLQSYRRGRTNDLIDSLVDGTTVMTCGEAQAEALRAQIEARRPELKGIKVDGSNTLTGRRATQIVRDDPLVELGDAALGRKAPR